MVDSAIGGVKEMEVSVFERLAAAREIQGTDYVDGDGAMCGRAEEPVSALIFE